MGPGGMLQSLETIVVCGPIRKHIKYITFVGGETTHLNKNMRKSNRIISPGILVEIDECFLGRGLQLLCLCYV